MARLRRSVPRVVTRSIKVRIVVIVMLVIAGSCRRISRHILLPIGLCLTLEARRTDRSIRRDMSVIVTKRLLTSQTLFDRKTVASVIEQKPRGFLAHAVVRKSCCHSSVFTSAATKSFTRPCYRQKGRVFHFGIKCVEAPSPYLALDRGSIAL
jgi:hypothetical protein